MPNTVVIDLLSFSISEEEKNLLLHPEVGGLLLFTRNIQSRAQLSALIASVRQIRSDIIIMIDHEGGYVQRIQRHGFTSLPAAKHYGTLFDLSPDVGLEFARVQGHVMASELIACGIDLSLAPVLDLHNPDSQVIGQLDRAFHADPDTLTALANAFIQGMHEAGMPSVGKHFPGHGSCVGDSHLTVPTNHKSVDELWRSDLKPFIDLIESNALDGIMPAYVLYPAIDSANTAGYSSRWLGHILRDELKFDGLVISDCLGMKGADVGDLPTRAQQALDAGCDLLIAGNQERATLLHLLNNISQARVPERERRFNAFKDKITRVPQKESQVADVEIIADAFNRTLGV